MPAHLPMISRPAIGDARGVVARVTRDARDDDAHSVEPGTRLVRRERRTGPELVGAIVHDDGLAPATFDEDAVFERHNAVDWSTYWPNERARRWHEARHVLKNPAPFGRGAQGAFCPLYPR
jgi:hypothetical protein